MARDVIDVKNLVFIDIETVCCVEKYTMLNAEMQLLWNSKAQNIIKSESVDYAKAFRDRGAIYSEFGKIIVIAIGKLKKIDSTAYELHIKALSAENEADLLIEFRDLVTRFDQTKASFCGHNIKEFDLPYICRRMVVHKIDLPECLNMSGKKPWEVPHIDTMEMWSFGDKKSFTSLHLLATILGIDSSKDSMNGSEVHDKFFAERDVQSIADYCKKDVAVAAQLYFRIKNLPHLNNKNIIFL